MCAVVFTCEVPHRLNRMAVAVGVHEAIWRPDLLGVTTAGDLCAVLAAGESLLATPAAWLAYFVITPGDPAQEQLYRTVKAYREACAAYPDAHIAITVD